MTDSERRATSDLMPTVLISCGVLLIASSFLPLSSLAERKWTIADSEAYSRVTRELHDATMESRSRAARTPEEWARYQENLDQQFEKLSSKLENAQQEPQRWSRILLWSGAGLTALGVLGHYLKQEA